jgi:hypothetical protein
VEHLVTGGGLADLGDEDLHLQRLHLVGEDLPEDLGVLVGEAARVHVVTAVLEALEVGRPHAGDAQLVELVVAADTGEGDAVVDLADLRNVSELFSATTAIPSTYRSATSARPRAMPLRA